MTIRAEHDREAADEAARQSQEQVREFAAAVQRALEWRDGHRDNGGADR